MSEEINVLISPNEDDSSGEVYFDEDDMDSWSHPRRRAYLAKHTNPNAYYYRFNDDNRRPKVGRWNEHEIASFMERVKEFGVNNNRWGEFSKTIKGRVGYQCSNFWRRLIAEGKVRDYNYECHYRNGRATWKWKRDKMISLEFRKYGFQILQDLPGPYKAGDKHALFPDNIISDTHDSDHE